MPSWLMSSSRPTNGDSSDAPALAASRPWLAVKISVQLVLMPSSAKRLDGLQAVLAHRHLDHDVRRRASRSARPSREHALDVVGDDLGATPGPGVILQISWRIVLVGQPPTLA